MRGCWQRRFSTAKSNSRRMHSILPWKHFDSHQTRRVKTRTPSWTPTWHPIALASVRDAPCPTTTRLLPHHIGPLFRHAYFVPNFVSSGSRYKKHHCYIAASIPSQRHCRASPRVIPPPINASQDTTCPTWPLTIPPPKVLRDAC